MENLIETFGSYYQRWKLMTIQMKPLKIENLLCSQGVVPVLVFMGGAETVGVHFMTVTMTCSTGAFGRDEARRFVLSFLLGEFMLNT